MDRVLRAGIGIVVVDLRLSVLVQRFVERDDAAAEQVAAVVDLDVRLAGVPDAERGFGPGGGREKQQRGRSQDRGYRLRHGGVSVSAQIW